MNVLPVAPTNGSPSDTVLHLLSNYVKLGTADSFTQAQFALRSLQSLQSIDQVFRIVRDAYDNAKNTKVNPQMLERHRAVLETLQAQASFLQAAQPAQAQAPAPAPVPASVPTSVSASVPAPVPVPASVPAQALTLPTPMPTPMPAQAIAPTTLSYAPMNATQPAFMRPIQVNDIATTSIQQVAPQQPLSVDDQRRMRYLQIQDGSGNVIVSLLTFVDTNDLSNASTVVNTIKDKDTLNRAFEASVLAFQTENNPTKKQAHAQLQELLRNRFRQIEQATLPPATLPQAAAAAAVTQQPIQIPTTVKTTVNSGPLPCWLYFLIGVILIALIAGVIALITKNSKKKQKATTTTTTSVVTVPQRSVVIEQRSMPVSPAAVSLPALRTPPNRATTILKEQQKRLRQLQDELDLEQVRVDRLAEEAKRALPSAQTPFQLEEQNFANAILDETSDVASGF